MQNNAYIRRGKCCQHKHVGAALRSHLNFRNDSRELLSQGTDVTAITDQTVPVPRGERIARVLLDPPPDGPRRAANRLLRRSEKRLWLRAGIGTRRDR